MPAHTHFDIFAPSNLLLTNQQHLCVLGVESFPPPRFGGNKIGYKLHGGG